MGIRAADQNAAIARAIQMWLHEHQPHVPQFTITEVESG